MFARFLRRVKLAAVDDGTHAGKRGQHVVFAQRQLRELPAQRRHQIGEFAARDGRLQVQAGAVVDIGGAHQGHALPRIRKHGTAIVRMHQADGLRQRQAPGRQQQMAAAQGPQFRRLSHLAAQAIGPGARGADHQARAHRLLTAADAIVQYGARHAFAIAQQRFHAQVIDGHAAMAARFLQHAQHQARVVRLGVLVQHAAPQPVAVDMWRQHGKVGRIDIAARAPARHHVIDGQAQHELAPPRFPARVVAKGKALRLDQPRRIRQQGLPLMHRFARQRELALLEVAQAAVHQLRGTARRAPGEIALFHQQRLQAAPRCFQQDAGARDAAADDQDVPVARQHARQLRPVHNGPSTSGSSLPGFIMPCGSTWRNSARMAAMPNSPFSAASHGA